MKPSSAARTVVILGSTGSIGTQAIDVVTRNPGLFRVAGLAARGGDVPLLARQVLEVRPEAVAVASAATGEELRRAIQAMAEQRSLGDYRMPKILTGPDALVELLTIPCDVVLNGLPGAMGLIPTLAVLDAGRTLALANKESLIVGGPLVRQRALPGQIVPVDSEHSALAQALRAGTADEVARLVLTASGGPFRFRQRAELADVTPEQALSHPTWDMGPLVTINSATMVNKGLEVIEAHLLFDVPIDRIAVVIHPQSVVHSMVEFHDGATIAQASPPDMRLPIALGLSWPQRIPGVIPGIDWSAAHTWEFFPVDDEAFPAVELAREVGRTGGTAPAVYNGANEVCVQAFLDGRLPFLGIVDTVARIVSEHSASAYALTVEDVLDADRWARTRACELIAGPLRRAS